MFSLLLTAAAAFGQVLEIHHIDVGQCDATLAIGPDKNVVLIDGGDTGKGSDGKCVIGYYISINATVSHTVVVRVTASNGRLSATSSTSFTPSA